MSNGPGCACSGSGRRTAPPSRRTTRGAGSSAPRPRPRTRRVCRTRPSRAVKPTGTTTSASGPGCPSTSKLGPSGWTISSGLEVRRASARCGRAVLAGPPAGRGRRRCRRSSSTSPRCRSTSADDALDRPRVRVAVRVRADPRERPAEAPRASWRVAPVAGGIGSTRTRSSSSSMPRRAARRGSRVRADAPLDSSYSSGMIAGCRPSRRRQLRTPPPTSTRPSHAAAAAASSATTSASRREPCRPRRTRRARPSRLSHGDRDEAQVAVVAVPDGGNDGGDLVRRERVEWMDGVAGHRRPGPQHGRRSAHGAAAGPAGRSVPRATA